MGGESGKNTNTKCAAGEVAGLASQRHASRAKRLGCATSVCSSRSSAAKTESVPSVLRSTTRRRLTRRACGQRLEARDSSKRRKVRVGPQPGRRQQIRYPEQLLDAIDRAVVSPTNVHMRTCWCRTYGPMNAFGGAATSSPDRCDGPPDRRGLMSSLNPQR